MFRIASRFLLLASLALATACTTPPPPQTRPLDFSRYQPLNINVANIEVIEAYKSPFQAPSIEHLMPYTPTDAVQRWVRDRLHAVGSDKILQITIQDARVTSTDLPKTKGLKGFFTNDQDKRYDAKLEVEMRVYGDDPLSEANTSVTVTRNITIPENATVNARNAAYEKMIFDLMDMFNNNMERNMTNYLGKYVAYSPN